MKMYGGKVCGVEVSAYGKENGYLDYRALADIVGNHVINIYIRAEIYDGWELINGELGEYDEVYQDYIITQSGAEFLMRYTDEIVFYNEDLDLYIWGITHFGISWDYVLTDIPLEERDYI